MHKSRRVVDSNIIYPDDDPLVQKGNHLYTISRRSSAPTTDQFPHHPLDSCDAHQPNPTQPIVRTNPATGIYHAQLVVLIDLTLHPPVQFRSIASIVLAPSFFAHVPPRFLTDSGNPQRPCQRRPHSSLVYPYHVPARILDRSILSPPVILASPGHYSEVSIPAPPSHCLTLRPTARPSSLISSQLSLHAYMLFCYQSLPETALLLRYPYAYQLHPHELITATTSPSIVVNPAFPAIRHPTRTDSAPELYFHPRSASIHRPLP